MPSPADPDRLARFRREAQVLASLNHPNIAGIFGFEESAGTHAIVLELVDGQSLDDAIAGRRPLPVPEVLTIAQQVASALEAAHDRDIVHRDLKPANIKLREDGTVKVLDFGLAKAVASTSESAPTLTAFGTTAGAIVGTPAYMSPEQTRGEPVGAAADIWSFGVVLYELLTGVSPFGRSTTAETLASILGPPPDYTLLPPHTPATVRMLVRRCLEKDPRRRWQRMGDVRMALEEAMSAPPDGPRPARDERPRRWRGVAATIAVTSLAGGGGWVLARRSDVRPSAAVVRLSIPATEPALYQPYGISNLAISDDGNLVAYASASHLWIRRLSQKDAVAVDVQAIDPFFSPDGKWVGFFTTTDVGLKKASVAGGAPVTITPLSERELGAAWRADGTIVFATSGVSMRSRRTEARSGRSRNRTPGAGNGTRGLSSCPTDSLCCTRSFRRNRPKRQRSLSSI